ncbi:MAG: homoserine dehydrogenase, partial [Candidatus Omnitrophica bacterium]|nr:homoserine dehydrogenase [Candidatus Omnitrophota bacterium]
MRQVKNKINIGVIGLGTIGSSLVKLLLERRKVFRDRTGIELNLSRVCDNDLGAKKKVKVAKDMFTRDAKTVINDPDIDIVVELVGGVHPAKEIIMSALSQGKHVVTANKLLLATEGYAIFKKAAQMHRQVFFEASVGGGIPIIRSIREGMVANTFSSIFGILNGTSNYILSKMSSEGVSFKSALNEAKQKGYAERDPSLDIKGLDSAHKIAILSLIAFGKIVTIEDV